MQKTTFVRKGNSVEHATRLYIMPKNNLVRQKFKEKALLQVGLLVEEAPEPEPTGADHRDRKKTRAAVALVCSSSVGGCTRKRGVKS